PLAGTAARRTGAHVGHRPTRAAPRVARSARAASGVGVVAGVRRARLFCLPSQPDASRGQLAPGPRLSGSSARHRAVESIPSRHRTPRRPRLRRDGGRSFRHGDRTAGGRRGEDTARPCASGADDEGAGRDRRVVDRAGAHRAGGRGADHAPAARDPRERRADRRARRTIGGAGGDVARHADGGAHRRPSGEPARARPRVPAVGKSVRVRSAEVRRGAAPDRRAGEVKPLAAAAAIVAIAGVTVATQNTPTDRVGGAAAILTSDDVLAVLTVAANALGNDTLAAAVVDRTGAILGVYARPAAAVTAPDEAVTLARAGAMFANDQAPLSSRTVRFISGIHYPPGIQNTPNAPLYGIESTNRGCQVDAAGDAVFNTPVARPASIAGTFPALPNVAPLPCLPSNTSGCSTVGLTTGKRDVFDSGQSDPATVPVNPGGVPIYRGGKVIGGVGVTGVPADFAEYAATLAAAGAGRDIDFSEPLGAPGAVFIDGVRLPFFGACPDIPCIRSTVKTSPAGAVGGRFTDG